MYDFLRYVPRYLILFDALKLRVYLSADGETCLECVCPPKVTVAFETMSTGWALHLIPSLFSRTLSCRTGPDGSSFWLFSDLDIFLFIFSPDLL